MSSKKVFLSLIPWVLFTLIGGHIGSRFVGWAAVAAGLIVVGLTIRGSRERTADGHRTSVKVIDALFVPFTEQYAREQVPRQYWHSPTFRAVNRHISIAFGVAVLAMTVCHFYSGYLESHARLHTGGNLVLNWVLPILFVVAALKYTDHVKGASAHPVPEATAG